MAKMDKVTFLSDVTIPHIDTDSMVVHGDLTVKGVTTTENSTDKVIKGAITVINVDGTSSDITLMGQVILTGYRDIDFIENFRSSLTNTLSVEPNEVVSFEVKCSLNYEFGDKYIKITSLRYQYNDVNVCNKLYGTFNHDNIERLIYDDTTVGWETVTFEIDGETISQTYQSPMMGYARIPSDSEEILNWFIENTDGMDDNSYGEEAYGILYDPLSESIRLGVGTYNYNAEQDTHEFDFSEGDGSPIAVRDLRAEDDRSLVMWDGVNYRLVSSPLASGEGVNSVQQKGAAADGDYSLAFGAAYDFSGSGKDVITQANASGSIALGAGVVANAEGSFAEGVNTVAGVCGAPKLTADVFSVINSLLEIPEVKTSIAKRLSISENLLTASYILGLGTDKIESVIYEFGGFGSHSEGIQNKAYATGSHAEGLENVVSGYVGHAEGLENVVLGYNGHAEGFHNTVIGQASHVEGYESTASGYVSHAEGYKTEASGKISHSEGSYAKATGECAHAEGRYTNAIGLYSHAEGSGTTQNLTGKTADQILQMFESKTWLSAAVGQNSHVEGTQNLAYGQQAHAENSRNLAKGNHSHAEGMYTKALGEYSHTEGFETVASGNQSHAGGLRTIASADSQTVIGRYNKENTNALFIVGNGSSVNNRSNAFEVVEGGINIVGKKSGNPYSPEPEAFDYSSSIRFENNENKYIGIYNHYTSFPIDEDYSYLSLDGYGSSIELGEKCQINGVTWLHDDCLMEGDLILDGTDLVMSTRSGTNVTLTAEKLAKIIKFIDSMEEVIE